ncbi:hypothetical protein NA56DRAFT_311470 [Hyaloscypha hepaticicola]|uniref:Uncharacterized protein n=1 Tax=Hyaloscypha hepaticicola TaxID=2082293 RepID=A0A2J6PR30_9HELO|nr:hypothetical protein NA56DRAFT_311470 [Hyaloscypha hepaticicola]
MYLTLGIYSGTSVCATAEYLVFWKGIETRGAIMSNIILASAGSRQCSTEAGGIRGTPYSALAGENLAHFENTHAVRSSFFDLGHGSEFRLDKNSKGTLSSLDKGSQEEHA